MKAKRCFRFLILTWIIPLFLLAETPLKTTHTFIERQGIDLQLDIYQNVDAFTSTALKPCIIFVFGGGFKEGKRDAELYSDFFHYFAENGFIVASIDYRLGLKEIKNPPSLFNQKPLIEAIHIAVEDLYAATNYLLENAEKWNIDSSKIIISGSSAGAITVLQADYEKRNSFSSSSVLPADFQYAGVMSFAGSIYSTKGTPDYKIVPAPTLFFHGSSDKLVPYKNIRFFKKGMFGSKSLAKKFKKSNYPYCFFSMEGIGHDVAEYPMKEYLPEIKHFIQNFVFDNKRHFIDVNIKDENRKSKQTDSPKDYYK